MLFRQLFDAPTFSYTYLLACEQTRQAVLVDPVLEQIDRDATLVQELDLVLAFVVDTHVHADHVTAAGSLRERLGCRTVVGERAGTGIPDLLVKQDDRLAFGREELSVRETPGHTGGCITLVADDASRAFTGDALLVRGCGRTDFQEGDAATLYRSVHEQIFTLPDTCALFPAHDYRGRTSTTVGEEKRHNPRLGGGRAIEEFVAIMEALRLEPPGRIAVSVPANLRSGVPPGLTASAETLEPARWAPVEASASGTPEISPEWLAAHHAEVTIVDVREPDELVGELGHIGGALGAPLKAVLDAARAWPKERSFVTVCRSGGRSAKAALALRDAGFSRVASLRGGMRAWNALGLPVRRA